MRQTSGFSVGKKEIEPVGLALRAMIDSSLILI